VGICRLHVLFDRRRDAEGELRAWMKRLTKQDTFVRPLEAVLAMVEEERTRVEGCQQKDFLEAALAADRRRRALQRCVRRRRATLEGHLPDCPPAAADARCGSHERRHPAAEHVIKMTVSLTMRASGG